MRILSVDPGSLNLGYVIGENDKIIAYCSRRLDKELYDRRFSILCDVLNQAWLKYQPDEISIELPVRFRGMKNPALEVAYQAILNWARSKFSRERIYSYHPATWRAGIAKSSKASKGYIARLVHLSYPELPEGVSDHVTDAAGILLYHVIAKRQEQIIKGEQYEKQY